MLSYLDKYVRIISSPMDIIRCFAKIEKGRRHVWLGLRVLFNYLEAMGYNVDYLNGLRKAIPKVNCGIDLKVPEEHSILESLRKSASKYDSLYNLLLDSGLRLVEAIKVVNEFERAEEINGFYRVPVGEFRGSKQSYYAYFTEATYQKLQVKGETLNPLNASHYFDKFGFVGPKYVRKFVFDKMIELEVPESVADFIEGRVPKRIGAKHYMVLRRQADKFYGRYAEYVTKLKREAGLSA